MARVGSKRARGCVQVGIAAAALLCSVPAAAESGDAPAAEIDDATPRAAMHDFLASARDGDYARAAGLLDLRDVPPGRRDTRGPELARELKSALDRSLWVDLEALSDEPGGAEEDDLARSLERVGSIPTPDGIVDVLLERSGRRAGEPRWRVARSTVSKIPVLYAQYGESRFEEHLPDLLRRVGFLEMRLWQWIAVPLCIAGAALLAWAATSLLLVVARRIARRLAPGFDETLLRRFTGPLRLALSVGAFAAVHRWLWLALPVDRAMRGAEKGLAILALTWVLLRAVDVVAANLEDHLRRRGRASATAVMPLLRRAAKAVMAILAGLAVVQNLGFDATGLIAGLGVGGLAVALAGQKTVENFFGGLTLVTDQPVRVGDFCRFGERIGTVEDIGLRSTRVRTLDRTVVTIPNAEFANLPLENYARRDRIWLHTTLGLRYETTPDQLRHVLIRLKQLLLAHPRIDPDPARVRFVGFGAYSLDLEIFAYARTADIDEFLRVREDVLLRVMDVVAESGTGFAFPSQTVYGAPDTGLDPKAQQAAEGRVRTWRERGELPLPDVPPDRAGAPRGTLPWPPEGAPASRGSR